MNEKNHQFFLKRKHKIFKIIEHIRKSENFEIWDLKGCSSNFVYKQINTILCKPLYLPQKSKIRTPVRADFIIYFSLYRGSDFDIIEAKGLCKPNLRFTQNYKNPHLNSMVLFIIKSSVYIAFRTRNFFCFFGLKTENYKFI